MKNRYLHIRRQFEEDNYRALQGNFEHLSLKKILQEKTSQESPPEIEASPKISLDTRYEAIYINGRPGSGKTQLLQDQMLPDLDMVAAGQACLVVVDPTDDKGGAKPTLIRVLTRLKRFAPGGDLHGRLIYINPTDQQYHLPVNLFHNMHASEESARVISSIITNYVQIIDVLLKQPLTEYQDPVFRWAVQVAMRFPNPSLETLIDVIAPTPEGMKPVYEAIFDSLDPFVQRYLRRTYETPTPVGIRERILARLESLNADPLFRQMFNGKRTSVDFRKLINEPNIIVINLSPELGSMRKLFTRYFMAQLYNAGEHRPEDPIPCFIYIDECDQIVDDSVGEMLRRLRKKNIGLTLANQETARLSEDAREAIIGVAVKFANSYEQSAKDIGRSMNLQDGAGRVNTSFLTSRPRFDFAFHEVGMDRPIQYVFKPFKMNELPAMTEEEWQEVWAGENGIRDRFYEANPEHQPAAPAEQPETQQSRPRRQKRGYPPQMRSKERSRPSPIEQEKPTGSEGSPQWGNGIVKG